MIDILCNCAALRRAPESSVGKRLRCPKCGLTVQPVSGETLHDGSGVGDFDAGLVITAGPEAVGTRILLGGVADVLIGKLPERHIVLPATLVSRLHCKLSRIDLDPSRWKLIDNHSTNGLFVNRQRVSEHELQDGDIIGIGEYQLEFLHFRAPSQVAGDIGFQLSDPAPAPLPEASRRSVAKSTATGGHICPSCEKAVPPSAKICVRCGINIATGRPVLMSHGVDEDSLQETARQWIRWVSLLVWVTPMPIPIRSEAYGTRKPYAIWTIASITILASITFFIAQNSGGEGLGRTGSDLMLWPSSAHAQIIEISPRKIHELARAMTPEDREALRREYGDADRSMSDDELVRRVASAAVAERLNGLGEFHWYQLITHAFLHDTSSIYNFAMHLAGNMVFMLVFGTRVNALIGNIATALLYPVLAVCAATAHLLSLGNAPSGPMLGASGAIMGLAGMYLILFPAHRVFCAMWISIWLRFKRIFGCKIFQLRGFWVLLIYFGYDILMNVLSSQFNLSGGVAHWAHIGGFVTGMLLALGILLSRLFNTRGSDVLSVTLGKYAWPLIGKPSRWNVSTPALPRATALNYA